jgi:hypothetical protein
MRRKIPDLAQALTGTFDANHAQLAKSILRRLELVEQALAKLDAVIVEACRPWQHQIDLLQTIPGRGEGRAGDHRRNWGGHVKVPDRRAPCCLGWLGASDE